MYQTNYYSTRNNIKVYPSNLIDNYYEFKIKNLKDSKDNYIWAIEYAPLNNDIYCFGIEAETGKHVKLKLNIEPGLFLFTHNPQHTEILTNILLPQQKIIFYENITFNNSNKTYLDIAFNTLKNKPMYLFKIQTKSFEDSKKLYYTLRSSPGINNVFELTHKWSIEMYLYLYQLVVLGKGSVSLFSLWIDSMLIPQHNITETKPKALLNLLYFDIETISSDPVRVPSGSCVDDYLFSVSLLICREGNKAECICLMYLPVDKDVMQKYIETISHKELFKQYGHIIRSRTIEFYNSELDILSRLFDLLLDPFQGEFFYSVGFNSSNYDMSFLYYRSLHYYDLYKYYKHFKFQIMCLTFGLNMYHVDLQMFLKKYYKEGNSFSLKTFSAAILDAENKEDVNPVTFRNLFMDVYNAKSDILLNFNYSNSSPYDLSKAILYNDKDTIVLFRIWVVSFVSDTLNEITKKHFLNIITLLYSMSGVFLEYYMIDSIITESNYFMVNSKNETLISTTDDSIVCFDKAQSIKSVKKSLNNSYDGGLNCVYCGQYFESYSLDFVTYYTKQLDGFNVSHETSLCLEVGLIKTLYAMGLQFDSCIFFMFHSHKSHKETDVTVYNFINGLENNDCFIINDILTNKYSFTDNQRLVLIYTGVRGFLSTYAKKQNELRSSVKQQKKCVSSYYDVVTDIIIEKQNRTNDGLESNDSEDEDMYDTSDDDDDSVKHNTNKVVVKTSNEINIELLMDTKLKKMTIDELKLIAEQANSEIQRLEAHDRSLKIYNSSLYGFLGSQGSVMRAKHVAAIVTFLGRRNIIETAKVVIKNGGKVLMVDTDGLIMQNKPHENTHLKVINEMIKENPCLELSSKKYNMTLILSKKVYVTKNDSNEYSSRGINKFGPHCWNQVLYFTIEEYYTNKTKLVNKQTLLDTMYKIFEFCYNTIKKDKTVAIITRKIKELSEYKKNCDITKLLRYMLDKNANVTFSKNIQFFFLLNENKPNDTILAPHLELYEEYDHTRVNLYKFLSKIHKPLFKIMTKVYMLDTYKNTGTFVMMNERIFKSMFLNVYLNFISAHPPTKKRCVIKRHAEDEIIYGKEKINKINDELFKHVINDSSDEEDFF